MKELRDAFVEGFVGALRLHLAIVLAPFRVVREFWNETPRYLGERRNP